MTGIQCPILLRRRRLRRGYVQFRCALCHRRFWPGQRRVKGANYYPHPFMLVHPMCAMLYDPNLRKAIAHG